MPKPYNFDRDFRRPVSKAIAAHMASHGYKAKDGIYVAESGDSVGLLPVRMAVEDGQVPCKVYAVFSPTIAAIFDDFVRFATENYAAALKRVEEKQPK